MEGLHDPKQNTPEGRARVVGSSAVLAHKMVDRYTSFITKLQGLISSQAFNDNQRKTLHVLYILILDNEN